MNRSIYALAAICGLVALAFPLGEAAAAGTLRVGVVASGSDLGIWYTPDLKNAIEADLGVGRLQTTAIAPGAELAHATTGLGVVVISTRNRSWVNPAARGALANWVAAGNTLIVAPGLSTGNLDKNDPLFSVGWPNLTFSWRNGNTPHVAGTDSVVAAPALGNSDLSVLIEPNDLLGASSRIQADLQRTHLVETSGSGWNHIALARWQPNGNNKPYEALPLLLRASYGKGTIFLTGLSFDSNLPGHLFFAENLLRQGTMVDTTGPEVEFTPIPVGPVGQAGLDFTATVRDPESGIESLTISVNGTEIPLDLPADGGLVSAHIQLVAGANELQLCAVNGQGTRHCTEAVSIFFDDQAPLLTIDPPTLRYTNGSPISITGIASDAHLADVQVLFGATRLAGQAAVGGDSTISFDFEIPTASFTEGLNGLEVIATDRFGRTARASVAVVLDTMRPHVSIAPLGSQDQPHFVGESRLVLEGGAVDTNGLASVQVRHLAPGATAAVSHPVSISSDRWQLELDLVDGLHLFEVEAIDPAGNLARATSTIVVDTVAPVLVPISPTIVSSERGHSVSFQVIDENIAAVYWSSMRACAWPSGACDDGALAAPVLCLHDGASGVICHVELLPHDGNFVLGFVAEDKAGNAGIASVAAVLDTAAPIVEVEGFPADGTLVLNADHPDGLNLVIRVEDLTIGATRVMLNGNIIGGGGGSDDDGLTIIHPLRLQADTVNSYELVATDGVGKTTTLQLTIIYDTQPPAIDFDLDDDDFVAASFRVSFDLSDELTGPALPVAIVVDGQERADLLALLQQEEGRPGRWSFSGDSLANPGGIGSRTVAITAVDGAGNRGSRAVRFTIDDMAPTVSLQPASGSYIAGANYLLHASADDIGAGVAETRITVGTLSESCAGALCQLRLDTTRLPDGPLAVDLWARDEVGNATSRRLDLVVANGDPASLRYRFVGGAELKGSVAQVEISVSDPYLESAACTLRLPPLEMTSAIGLAPGSGHQTWVGTFSLAELDGEFLVTCSYTTRAGAVVEGLPISALLRNWEIAVTPKTLQLASKGGENSITVRVDGPTVGLLLGKPVFLRAAGGEVQATAHPASTKVQGNSLVFKFDRQALLSRLGLEASAKKNTSTSYELEFLVGRRLAGADTILVR